MALEGKGKEWLESDGLGGFASGGADGIRTRRYHALLLPAMTPPTGRFVLVNGFDAWVETSTGIFAISSQQYTPDVIHPDGNRRIQSFTIDPWPTWIFELEDGTRIQQEIFVRKNSPATYISWRLLSGINGTKLTMRPFLSGRDYHSMHHENGAFRFDPQIEGDRVIFQPYSDLPRIVVSTNGAYHHEPSWYRNFQYEQERTRGLDFSEDLASPGVFQWDLQKGEAICIFSTQSTGQTSQQLFSEARDSESKRRKQFPNRLARAADDYIVARKTGKTIVAGYPWFTDWGRDTFIALRGLCLTTGRLKEARDILIEWAGAVSEGMLPNRFPDHGTEAEYNSVDASLWYVIAVGDYLQATRAKKGIAADRRTLGAAIEAILTGYRNGTRFRIHMDEDALLAAGQSGFQLTWMDAKIGDWVITPRIGKPVEIQALWINALLIGSQFSEQWKALYQRAIQSFQARFWNASGGYLYDVIDVDHENGRLDDSFRPNQIFAVGGLPVPLIEGERALSILNAVEARLLTPLGLRSLAPGSPDYRARYEGGVRDRDSIYHQGIVWPWLIGPFIEAWLRVNGNTATNRKQAREKFLDPLLLHLDEAGLGHISEIADAEPPYTPRGCPFQAWSVGEALRAAAILAGD